MNLVFGITGKGVVRAAVFGIAVLGLTACGQRQPQLMQLRSNTPGPDEFAVIPTKPIEIPDDLSALPPPQPGTINRTDQNPFADAAAALGGNPNAAIRDGQVSGSDAALLRTTGRYGASPTIRAQTATEDLEFRRKNRGRLLERWFNVTTYYNAYERQNLDQYGELERYRAAGSRTSSVPPETLDEDG